MAMGIVSDKEFDLERDKLTPQPREESNSVPIKGEIVDVEKGRGKGNVEVPNSLRQVIGETAALDGREEALKLAKEFGISPSSVSAYGNGSTSTSSYSETPNRNHITQSKNRISKRARAKLMRALHHITDEKLGESKARDLAGIARDMSAVVKNMDPEPEKNPTGENQGPTFIFYSPQFRDERHFDVIHAKE